MSDPTKGLKEEATGSSLTVDQLVEIIGGMSQTEKSSLLGKIQGTIPKIKSAPEVDAPVDNRAPFAHAELRDRGDHKLPKLPKFSGSSGKNEPSFRVWRFEIDNLEELYSEREVIRIVHQSVTGVAAETLMRLGKEASLTQIKDKFDHVFGTVVSDEKLLADFYTAQQKSSESVAEWSCRLEDIISHPKLSTQITSRDKMLKSRFFYGLHNETVKNAIRHRFELGTFEDLLVLAREAEDEGKSAKAMQISKPQTLDPFTNQLKEIKEQLSKIQSKMNDYDKRLSMSQKKSPNSKFDNKDSRITKADNKDIKCFYCRQAGHVKRNCPKLTSKGKLSTVGSSQ